MDLEDLACDCDGEFFIVFLAASNARESVASLVADGAGCSHSFHDPCSHDTEYA